MPWQRQVADVGGEIDPETGRPCYRSVILTVPRQQGKTLLILAWSCQRAIGWGSPQRLVYSAQTGSDARKKLVEDQMPLLRPVKKDLGISRFYQGQGAESILWANGSRLVLLASNEDSGHGKTVDFAVKDELFADIDFRRDQALEPSMMTRSFGQVLTASTAGTDASVALNREVAAGRLAVESGKRSGTAYFEWSADPDCDPDDPAVWWGCMPALGYTVEQEVIQHARDRETDGDFRRAFLNIPTISDERVIPAGLWDSINAPDHKASGRPVFAVDVGPERDTASIALTDGDVLEVGEQRPGVDWVVGRCRELAEKHNRPQFAVDGTRSAPVSALIPELRRGVGEKNLVEITDLSAACGSFYDRVADHKIKVRRHAGLDSAVAGAQRRFVGDGWVWARRGTVDITPLVASTFAMWVATSVKKRPVFW